MGGKKMTLAEYKNSRYEDLFLAVIKKEIDWENADKIILDIPDIPFVFTAHDALRTAVRDALVENNQKPTEENMRSIEEEVKQTIGTNLEETNPVILLKTEEGYIDLSVMKKLESEYKVVCLIPFKKYYGENDYSFNEDEDGPYLEIDMEPFEKFFKDYEEGKFN